MGVKDYRLRFDSLVKCALMIIDTIEVRIHKFIRGLNS